MTSEEGRIGAVLNGEIYNYVGLRKSLLEDGHILASEGDTEVIAHLANISPLFSWPNASMGCSRSPCGTACGGVWSSVVTAWVRSPFTTGPTA